MREGAVAGFKYFKFDGTENEIGLELRGKAKAQVLIDSPDGKVVAEVESNSEKWEMHFSPLKKTAGNHALFVKCTEGSIDFAKFVIR